MLQQASPPPAAPAAELCSASPWLAGLLPRKPPMLVTVALEDGDDRLGADGVRRIQPQARRMYPRVTAPRRCSVRGGPAIHLAEMRAVMGPARRRRQRLCV